MDCQSRVVYQNHILSISHWLGDAFDSFIMNLKAGDGVRVKTSEGIVEAMAGDTIKKCGENFSVIKKLS